jgi:hypothetical protein
MLVQEQQYIDRATQRLAEPLELSERVKILKTLSQIYAREARVMEDRMIELEAVEV